MTVPTIVMRQRRNRDRALRGSLRRARRRPCGRVARARRFPARNPAPTRSRITSTPCPSVRSRTTSAKSSCSCRSLESERGGALQLPRALLVPKTGRRRRDGALPCRRHSRPRDQTRSPRRSPSWVNSASCAVRYASGTAAASSSESGDGTASASSSWTTTYSAYAPPPTIPITRAPTLHLPAPAPVASTTPAYSRPGTSAGTPGGAG